MKREPIEIKGVDGELFAKRLKLSERFEWQALCKENKHIMMPSLLHFCIVNENGTRLKTTDEWDEFGDENFTAVSKAFATCIEMIGNTETAKKK